MVFFKSDEEIELIRQSGNLLAKLHAELAKMILPGVTTIKLDKFAEEYIRDNGGYPSFKGYKIKGHKKAFPCSLCISVNSQVVHGIASDYKLNDGEIVSIDCGILLNGFHSDSAYTYPVGTINDKMVRLLKITKESLYIGIDNALPGKRVGDIGYAIQKYVENANYSIVRELVGHGVGRSLHENPEVPNYGKRGKGTKLKEGMVLAIEPMVNAGKKDVVQEKNGWTIITTDRKPSAHFEHTVAIKKGKAIILTTFEYIEEVLNQNPVRTEKQNATLPDRKLTKTSEKINHRKTQKDMKENNNDMSGIVEDYATLHS